MAIIDFPSSPSVNDTYSFGNKTWVFNGQGWQLVSSSAINDVVIGNITPASGNFTTVGATGNITASGNIAGSYILGNGAFLTGIAAGYSNANVKDYLGNFDGNIIPSANVTYDLGSNTNRWNDLYLNNSTIYIGAQEITANASTTVFSGNVAANYLFGNASFLVGVTNYSNANVANYLPNYQGVISNVDFRSTSPAAVALVVTDRPLTMGGNSLSYVTLPDDGNANSVAAELTNHGLGNVLISAGPADYEWIFDHTGNLTLPGSTFAVNYANGAQVSLAGTYSNINVKAYLESGSMINANFDGGTLKATGVANLGPTTINGNLAVAGNITASGNLTYINVQDLVIDDPLIQLAANNPGDTEDLGIVAGYNDGTARHTGFARDYTDQTWKVFTGVTSDPNTVIAWSQAVYAPFKAGPILSNASITANANVTATGNVSGTYILGNGAFLTGLPAGYSNADVANYLASNAAVTILTTGNITTQGNLSVGNLVGVGDNVDINAGTYFWSFNNTGNLVLPANSFSINYANGTQVSLSGSYGNSNVASYLVSNANIPITIGVSNITTQGNIAGNYFIGNGALLTGLAASYSNSNVANYLPTYTGNLASLAGNVTTTANVAGAWFIGNINATNTITTTGNITANNFIGSDPNVGLVAGSYTWLFDNTGNFNLPANTFNVNYANGVQVSLGGTYSNAEAANYLASNANVTILTTGNITTAGNITGNYILGNGALLTGLPATYSNANVANYLPTYTGNLASLTGNVTTTANVAGAWFIGNINATNTITTTGNITANNFVGSDPNVGLVANGYTWLFDNTGNVTLPGNVWAVNYANGSPVSLAGTYSNSNVATYLASNAAVTILTTGNITTSANVSGAYIIGNGAFLTDINAGNIIGSYGNSQVAAYLQVYNGNASFSNVSVSRDMVVLGNLRVEGNTTEINVSNIFLADKDIIVAANANATLSDLNGAGLQIGNRTAGGNITFFYDSTSNVMSLSHGANIANVLNVTGNITATGNITGNFLLGNIRSATGGYGDANVAAYTGALTNLTGNVTTTANVSGAYLLGNGAFITGLPAGYSNADVANYLPTYTGNVGAGNLNLTGNIVDTGAIFVITGANGNVVLAPNGTSRIIATTLGANVVGNLDVAGNVNANGATLTGNLAAGNLSVANGNITVGNLVGAGTNVEIVSGAYTWTFDGAGNLTGNGNISAGNFVGSAGNTSIVTGAYAWVFNDTGNLVLPGNGFSVNYANGTQVSLGGSYSNSEAANYLASNAAVTILTTGNITTAANIAGNYFIGNGALLTGVVTSSYSNANVANYLPTYTGNVGAGNLNLTGNIVDTGAIFVITGANGNVVLAPNGTSRIIATGSGANVIGNLDVAGNVNANGATLTGNITAGNLSVANGNITLGNLVGSGTNVEIVSGAYTWTFDGAGNLTGNGNISAGNFVGTAGNTSIVTNAYSWTFNDSGNLVLPGNTFAINYANGAQVSLSGSYSNVNVKAYLESGATINANFGGGTLKATGVANLGPTTVNGNLVVAGNISATGNLTYINVQDLVIDDPLIQLAANNPGDTEDLGIVAGYNDGTAKYTGIVRDYTDSTWKVFANVVSDPNTVVAWSQAVYAPFKAGPILSNASITANANVTATGNISGTYLLGNGYFISGIQYSNITGTYGNSNVAAYLPTYTGNLASLTGNVITTANVTGNYFIGNGALLTGLPATYSNANVANYLPTYTGNVGAGNLNLTGNIVDTVGPLQIITGSSGNIGLAVGNSNVLVASTNGVNVTGYLTATGDISTQGNITVASIQGANANTTIVANVYSWAFDDTGNFTLPGNSFAVNYANGTQISLGGSYSNAQAANYLASNAAVTILTTGNITTSANIAGNYFIGNGALLTGLPATYSNANVANYLPTYTGNVSAGNLNLTGNIVDTGALSIITGSAGNITLAPNSTSVLIATTTGVNIAGYMNATGNLSAGNFIGSGTNVELTAGLYTWIFDNSGNFKLAGNTFAVNYANGTQVSLSGTYANSNVATYLASNAAVTVLTTGNITTAANVSGAYILGNGAFLSGLPVTYSNSNVAAYLAVYNGNALFSNITVSQDAVVLGNLRVEGNTTYINVTDLIVEDKDIIVAANATATLTDLNGAGLQIGNRSAGGNITFFYNSTSNVMSLSHGANIANVLNVTGNITATGNTTSGNVNLTGNIVDTGALTIITGAAGNITLAPNSTSVLIATTTGVNIAGYLNTTGNISAGNVIGSGNNVEVTAGSYNWAFDNTGNFTLSGNTFAVNYANGTQVALGGNYSNTNVAAYLPTYTGNISAGNVTAVGNVSANNISANSISANAVSGSNVNVRLISDSYTWTFNNTGNFVLPGNSFSINYANGSQVSLSGTYSNTNVAAYLPTYTGAINSLTGNVITTANVSGAYLLGNGYFVSGIQYSNITGAYGNANVKTYLESSATINANFGGGNITTTGTANLGITQVNGNLVVTGNISATGNITYINVSDLVVSDPLLFLAANNPGDTEDIGLVANYNPGSGNLHTGFARDYTDGTWKLFQGVTSDPNTVIAWNEAVYAPFKAGSILSNASITANANVTATGNVTGNFLLGNGYFVSGIQYSNITGTYGNSNVADYLPTYTGNLVSLTGNIITTGNITASYVLPQSNATTDLGSNTLQWRSLYVSNNTIYIGGVSVGVTANGQLTVAGNTVVTEGTSLTGNIETTGNVSAGNLEITRDAVILGNLRVQGNTTYINVSDLIVEDKDIIVGANASATLSDLNGAGLQIGNISAGGNITFFYNSTSNTMALSHGANIANTVGVTGNINASGNISGLYLLGNGSQLTGISAGAVIADDTTTNSNYYPVFATATSGSLTTATISSTKLTFNPSSGTLTAVDVNTSSDAKFKENVQQIASAVDTINSIQGVSFNWKETGQRSYGIIAQELAEVLPELVHSAERGLTVSYLPLIAILIEAIKEQQQQIDQLKNTRPS